MMMDQCALMNGIQDIDLQLVKQKLMDPDEGTGWSADFCDAVCQEYLRFLALVRACPELVAVPSRIVDQAWHWHILDTRRYAADCERVLGYFLHHDPQITVTEADAEAALRGWAADTLSAYRQHFGEPPAEIWGIRDDNAAKCGAPVAGAAPNREAPEAREARARAKCGAPAHGAPSGVPYHHAKCGAPQRDAVQAKCGIARAQSPAKCGAPQERV